MPRQMALCLALTTALSLTCGCTLMQKSQEFTHESMRAFKPRTSDYRDFTDETDDQWAIAGKEGRADVPPEKDPDPWFKKWFMSPKARSIERNLGYE